MFGLLLIIVIYFIQFTTLSVLNAFNIYCSNCLLKKTVLLSPELAYMP